MRRFAPVFLLCCVALVLFFHQEESPNPFSRLLTPFALVESHGLEADAWGAEAYDKAVVGGHTYSDKAPLSSLIVLPFYAAMRLAEGGPQTRADIARAVHLGTLVCAAIPFSLFALLLLWRARREGASATVATVVALGCVFGTFAFNYGGAFFGHMLAATFLVGGWALAVEKKERFVLAGFLGGCSVLTEYPLVLLQAAVVLMLVLGPQGMKRARSYVLGASPCAVLLLVWNLAVTGSAFDFPYSHVPAAFQQMHHQFGFSRPDFTALWELCFGQFRGAFFYAPALLLFLPLRAFDVSSKLRRNTVLAACLAYLLFVSSYFQWDGGWCTGPRHLLPAVALLLYEGAGLLARQPRFWKAFAGLSLFGLGVNLLAVATNPCPNDAAKYPVAQIWWPRLVHGATADAILVDLGAPRGAYLVGLWVGLAIALSGLLVYLARRWLDEVAPEDVAAPQCASSSRAMRL